MSAGPYWSDTYRIFGPLFYDLIGFYELQFNRDPTRIIDYDKVCVSSETLPIYGMSRLPRYAMYLSQLPIINRLTEIKQLAYTYVLFPGATHTRYEHSRGVMHRGASLLSKVRERLENQCKEQDIRIDDDDKVILDIAALLHDLGHPAWGHALDGITGYVVELLKEIGIYLFSPRKLDITIALYLLLANEQLSKSLSICSKEVKDEKIRKLLGKIVAQIIMEEEHPLFEEIENDGKLVKKTHLLTTILGSYRGRPGINADRLDWLVRDSHHANLGAKLSPDVASKYDEYLDLNKKDDFSVGIRDCEFSFIDDKKFNSLMTELREKIYSTVYEGLERSFTDSLLIRLAYSAINVANTVGNSIASAPMTTRAIMGYLLMYDYLMKEYTTRLLHLAKQHTLLLGITEPSTTFISKSDDLLKLVDDIRYIMHYLSSNTPKESFLTDMRLHLNYVELEQITKNLIIVTAKTFAELIERSMEICKATDPCKLAILFQDILAASRINALGALRVPTLENSLQDKFKDLDVYLLVNYYFFRKLDDCFREEIWDSSSLKKTLEEKMTSTPLFFIIFDKTDLETMKKIFANLSADILNNFVALFQSMSL